MFAVFSILQFGTLFIYTAEYGVLIFAILNDITSIIRFASATGPFLVDALCFFRAVLPVGDQVSSQGHVLYRAVRFSSNLRRAYRRMFSGNTYLKLVDL